MDEYTAPCGRVRLLSRREYKTKNVSIDIILQTLTSGGIVCQKPGTNLLRIMPVDSGMQSARCICVYRGVLRLCPPQFTSNAALRGTFMSKLQLCNFRLHRTNSTVQSSRYNAASTLQQHLMPGMRALFIDISPLHLSARCWCLRISLSRLV